MRSCIRVRIGHRGINIAAAGGRLIGSLGSILVVLGRESGPRGEKTARRSLGSQFSAPGDHSGPISGHF